MMFLRLWTFDSRTPLTGRLTEGKGSSDSLGEDRCTFMNIESGVSHFIMHVE